MEAKKAISFQIKPEIRMLYTWRYAHQQARKGTWHIDAIDRMRFQKRIEIIKSILDPFLQQHMRKIKNSYNKKDDF